MIKHLLRATPVFALAVVSLAAPASATPAPAWAAQARSTAATPRVAPSSAANVPLFQALSWIEEAPEGTRDGYSREQFKHWNKGLNPTDGCDTRKEVILSEALEAPEIGPKCTLTGGRWWSEYDQKWITSAKDLDVDHMVPLAEAWDSGAATWTAARREAYANDQGAPNSLIAVSGSSNRSKADKDPADWLPVPDDRCKYTVDWVADKLRWRLTADAAEHEALSRLAESCPTATVSYDQVA
ncbi:HNH endonuclease [Kitasatospora sp. RG8]|uniref:HNH endonuclease family protein n=1 Tax=Kitasatospora sp. RG8 TaxID=2820815 RepID=UPI001AE0E62D|nr:HNH endonuclease family protein [Kitasatospora sp. RG8]MBP0454042.1 HNH endonuclease [Kitasatospora sp. RG8]